MATTLALDRARRPGETFRMSERTIIETSLGNIWNSAIRERRHQTLVADQLQPQRRRSCTVRRTSSLEARLQGLDRPVPQC